MVAMTSPPKKKFINTIAEYHKLASLPVPGHPLLSVINFEDLKWKPDKGIISVVHNFYSVILKKNDNAKCRYGQKEEISIHEGGLHFMSPKQVLTIEAFDQEFTHTGWLVLIHPDFFWNTSLAKKVKQYGFFSYATNEGLTVSVYEEATIFNMIENIAREIPFSNDPYDKEVNIVQIELLLTYSDRIYKRQLASVAKTEHRTLERLETLISKYLRSDELAEKGIPTVPYIAGQLHISPNYLSRLLQSIMGQSTKNYLHDKLIDLAKEKLSTTELSVSEIAFGIGFKSPQSFSKLFKTKTSLTPLEFRQSFN